MKDIELRIGDFEKYDLKEWKLIYSQLRNATLAEPQLLDSEMLSDLQTYLQGKAESIDLDPLDHETWINWLNNAEKCGASVQVSNRNPAIRDMNLGTVLPEIKSMDLIDQKLKTNMTVE